jgi:hypothetical protein
MLGSSGCEGIVLLDLSKYVLVLRKKERFRESTGEECGLPEATEEN